MRGPNGDVTLPAPNGSALVALVRNAPPPPRQPAALTDFEQRHEARFKGRQFDWLDFQRDGQDYPVASRIDPYVTPAQELWIRRDGAEQQLLMRYAQYFQIPDHVLQPHVQTFMIKNNLSVFG